MKKSIFGIILILFSLNAAAENKSEILVAAAPSVKMVVEKAAEIFMKKNADVSIKFSFAATGAIQNQIENGAPIDAYRDWETDRKSTRLNSSHITRSRIPSSA